MKLARRLNTWRATHEGLVLVILIIILGCVIGWQYLAMGGRRTLGDVIFGVAVAVSAHITMWAGRNVVQFTAWLRSR